MAHLAQRPSTLPTIEALLLTSALRELVTRLTHLVANPALCKTTNTIRKFSIVIKFTPAACTVILPTLIVADATKPRCPGVVVGAILTP